jgi:sterol desaturase/sphingolipid hydroxylase (fatty acid hydroxylase superfamily)
LHHSSEAEHRDRNFGGVLTIWDRLFGTLFRDYDVYPRTGVENPDFPLEHSARPAELLKTYGRQLVHPFRATYRTLRTG